MAHNFINQIQPGQTIDDIYLVKDPILRSTTRGDLYIAMYILDRTGQLNGRMWQATEQIYNSLPKPGFVCIKGRSELYQGNLQVVINNVSIVPVENVSLEDFLAKTDKDTDQLFTEVQQMVGKIENKQILAIVGEFLNDKPLMHKFCNAPAAVKMHHCWIGGLLEHTHSMLKVATALLPIYAGKVQPDLVLAGILLHDMGKTEELSYDIAFSYTDAGQLIGHISKSLLMLQRKVDDLEKKGVKISPEIVDVMGHIILSHHGQYDFGSPKLPAMPEAFMVNYIDDLDAKINQVSMEIDKDPSDNNWTGWINALQTRLYRKTID